MRAAMSRIGGRIAMACAVVLCAAAGPHALTFAQEAPTADDALRPEDSALIAQALSSDPRDTVWGFKPRPAPAPLAAKPLDIARTDNPDGTSTVYVKQAFPGAWDANIGADLGFAADESQRFRLDDPMYVVPAGGGSGAAWASVALQPGAIVDARVDPANDQGRIGTSLTRAIPLGTQFAVTLSSSASLTEHFSALSAVATDQPESYVWDHRHVAQLDIRPTGTLLTAALSSSSTDPVTHNTFSAEQKLYGPLHVTTAVNDIGQPGESKRIDARFKLTW